MKWWLFGALGVGIGVLSLDQSGEMAAGQGKKAAPGWATDYNAAKAAAKQSGKPMFIVFR